MSNVEIFTVMKTAVALALKIGGPILLLSMAVGVLISIIQAATQIHEQTITFVPKLILVALVLLIAGGWMLSNLQDFTNEVFSLML